MPVRIALWQDVDYVYGTVNGVGCVWTRGEGVTWSAIVEPSEDGMYFVDISAHDVFGRETPLRATLYYSNGLTWKTDWKSGDNYAREGVTDCARLWFNYAALRDELRADFGFDVNFSVPLLDGYATLPKAAFLNLIETALEELRVYPVLWVEGRPVWASGGSGPASADINRWEVNGREIERAMRAARQAWMYSGEDMAESGADMFF